MKLVGVVSGHQKFLLASKHPLPIIPAYAPDRRLQHSGISCDKRFQIFSLMKAIKQEMMESSVKAGYQCKAARFDPDHEWLVDERLYSVENTLYLFQISYGTSD